MDSKDKITDLSEPTPRHFSPEEERQRKWHLLTVFLSFAAGYALIHKLLVPSVLAFTRLKTTPYAQIDWWFIHPILLALLMQRSSRNTPTISFLAGIGIIYGIYDVYEASLGRYVGWLMFSRLLSAIPVSIACGFLMSKRIFGGSLRAAWLGVIVFLAFASGREYWIVAKQNVGAPAQTAADSRGQPLAVPDSECGAQELRVTPQTQAATSTDVSIEDCGLRPSKLFLDNGTLNIKNQSDHPVNLRLFIRENGQFTSRWNLLVPARSSMTSPSISLRKGKAALLMSDTSPTAGIISLVSPDNHLVWKFTRKPVAIEVIP